MAQATLLWKSYSESKTNEEREKLIERYAPLAKHVVDRLHIALPASMSYEDLIGQAILGLIEAVDSFDPGRGVKFETYAYHRIRGSVMDMLRNMDWMPRSLRRKEKELDSAYAALEMELGRIPSDEEIAAVLDITVDELAQLNSSLRLQSMQSLNEVVANGQGEAVETLELIADDETHSPEECFDRQVDKQLLAEAIEHLPEKEKLVVGLYYQEGLTLKEIAAVLGVSESRACQLHSRALQRLRAELI